jgi:hypothetical protein
MRDYVIWIDQSEGARGEIVCENQEFRLLIIRIWLKQSLVFYQKIKIKKIISGRLHGKHKLTGASQFLDGLVDRERQESSQF